MSAKDTVIGTAKQIVAELVGDGRLAEEGSRQAAGERFASESVKAASHSAQSRSPQPLTEPTRTESSHMDENRFAALLGNAALKTWADLPREAQERLFAAAVDDGVVAHDLAEFLHQRHPKTAHPPRPPRLA